MTSTNLEVKDLTPQDIEWLKACSYFLSMSKEKQQIMCDEMEQHGIDPKAVAVFRSIANKK